MGFLLCKVFIFHHHQKRNNIMLSIPNLSSSEPNHHLELKAAKKVVHPKYNFFTYENDLALVRTERRVTFADNIIPICLPGNDDLLIGEFGTVAGWVDLNLVVVVVVVVFIVFVVVVVVIPISRWGRLSEGGVLPSILQHVSVPILSNEKCKNMFLKAGRHEVIPEIFMCAGYENGKMDSCQVFFCNHSMNTFNLLLPSKNTTSTKHLISG